MFIFSSSAQTVNATSCAQALSQTAYIVRDFFLYAGSVSPVATIYNISHCITMNLQSHRGSYTSLTFITIILIPVFPLFDSVSGGVYTVFSAPVAISLSILDRLN